MVGQKKKVRSKAKVIQSSDEGEGFDLNVSDSSDSAATGVRPTGSNTSRPRAAPAAAVVPTVVNPIGLTPPTVVDAAKLPTGSNRSLQAQDTAYFYVKRSIDIKGAMTIRKVCRLCL
jgi:hypothetical protein